MRSADLSLNAKGSSVFALGLLFLSAALSACSARVVRVAKIASNGDSGQEQQVESHYTAECAHFAIGSAGTLGALDPGFQYHGDLALAYPSSSATGTVSLVIGSSFEGGGSSNLVLESTLNAALEWGSGSDTCSGVAVRSSYDRSDAGLGSAIYPLYSVEFSPSTEYPHSELVSLYSPRGNLYLLQQISGSDVFLFNGLCQDNNIDNTSTFSAAECFAGYGDALTFDLDPRLNSTKVNPMKVDFTGTYGPNAGSGASGSGS
ncbi:MAG: hypothetical protein EBX52_07755 [Proteobacteria bacterium]|nr:hypothetical protein [Pseudomonadota bacterium]